MRYEQSVDYEKNLVQEREKRRKERDADLKELQRQARTKGGPTAEEMAKRFREAREDDQMRVYEIRTIAI